MKRSTQVEASSDTIEIRILDPNGRPRDKSTLPPTKRASIDRLQLALQDLHSNQPDLFWIRVECGRRGCEVTFGKGEPPKKD